MWKISITGIIIITLAALMTASRTPRGIRNNNPGNIRKGNNWVGEVVGFDSEFESFATMEDGIRALAKLLKNYIKTGNNTVRKIINKYAPSSENDTAAYVAQVAKAVGVSPDFPLDARHMRALVVAIIKHENGGTRGITSAQIDAGISRA